MRHISVGSGPLVRTQKGEVLPVAPGLMPAVPMVLSAAVMLPKMCRVVAVGVTMTSLLVKTFV